MPQDKICKTVRQVNKEPVSEEDMKRLVEIAEDFRSVKNYVYQRYGGIRSLSKIYPGYTVQNEMTAGGLRTQLGMPSVYFYLAVFDALGDIKSQWTRTKSEVSLRLLRNQGFGEADRHYLRFLLKVSNAFSQVLNGEPVELKKELQAQYGRLAECVDAGRLNRWLCRQVRRCHARLHTDSASGFSLTERAYRYGDHGIYVSAKEKRRRIFIQLTDNNQYNRQLYMKLNPEEGSIEIRIPVDVGIRSHKDYDRPVGIALGMHTMLTTHTGSCYGEDFGRYQLEYAGWLRAQAAGYRRSRADNPGRKKYHAKKRRLEERLHSYINQELNRFFREERPQTVYLAKLPKPRAGGGNKEINHSVSMWQRGYIRRRLAQKCMEESVEMAEVLGKGISSGCSRCGGTGIKKDGMFSCPVCGYSEIEKVNTACNAKKRGQEGLYSTAYADHKEICPDKSRQQEKARILPQGLGSFP